MADLEKMDRTWLCSVLFMDIVNYSSQSVDTQMNWKARFNGYLADAIRDTPESERVILDTGDGAAVCFLGAPEVAMFAALHLWQCFVRDEGQQQHGFRVRTGVNLGPVKLVKDLNGRLNALGEGINSGQRVMSFAPENQILVSQSYFEVVSCLSDDYKALFTLRGVETDKHVREHTVYNLLPPGSAKREPAAAAHEPQPPVVVAALPPKPKATPPPTRPAAEAAAVSAAPPQKRSAVPLLVAGAVAFLVVAALAWRFAGPGRATAASSGSTPAMSAASQTPAATQPPPQTAQAAPETAPATQAAPEQTQPQTAQPVQTAPAETQPPPQMAQTTPRTTRVPAAQPAPETNQAPPASVPPAAPQTYTPPPAAPPAPSSGNPEIDQLSQAIQANPNDAQSYFRRAALYGNLRQFAKAIQDYDQVIRLQPNNAQAYKGRADVKQMAGDGRGAATDRIYAYQLQRR